MPLPEDRRQQLDGIVSQMEANGEPAENIQAVVEDFKTKYSAGAPAPAQSPGLLSRIGGALSDLAAVKDPTAQQMALLSGAASTQKDLGIGAAKGLANTVTGLGDFTNWLASKTGLVDRDANAFDAARQAVAPTNPVQNMGQGAEQVGEFLAVPGPAKARGAAALAEAAKAGLASYGLARAQGSSEAQAALAGATGGLPIVEGGAKAAQWLGEKAVRSVLKPAFSAMQRISGNAGADAKAAQLVGFIVDNGLTTPEKATALLTQSEQELQRILAVKNAPTDAATRAQRYLDALEKNASKQGLPEASVRALRAKGEELLTGPMGQDVVTKVARQVPTAIVDAAGNPIVKTVVEDQVARQLRPSVPAQEALDSARASSKWQTQGTWGPQTTAESAAAAATKAVERAQRDAVKAAVPEAAPILNTEAQAIAARSALERAAWREGNHSLTGVTGAVERGLGGPGVIGFATELLRSGQLQAGVATAQLAKAVQRGNAPEVAFYLQKLGVQVPAHIKPWSLAPATP